jgi:iron(II)-dependent oxidoreductase
MGWFSRSVASDGAAARGGRYEPAPLTTIPDDPLAAAVQLRRYGVLLRPPELWRRSSQLPELRDTALQKVDEEFALVPEGVTSIELQLNGESGGQERDVATQPFLLARCAVTNADYQLFVDAAVYQDSSLWPEAVWPHLMEFCDQTGTAGPRYWRGGRHDRRLARHPVVGVSWLEASVYAAWAGYRLPTEPEWQVAAAWQLGPTAASPRRYPWGDALDLECCNIWASGHNRPLPVEACPAGAAPNGVLQLIGNTWEWVEGDLDCRDEEGCEVVGEAPLKVIRGGAFDTYFPWQATSTFRSGLPMLARAHNVGFRCALDVSAHQQT